MCDQCTLSNSLMNPVTVYAQFQYLDRLPGILQADYHPSTRILFHHLLQPEHYQDIRSPTQPPSIEHVQYLGL